jgi:hypothetical protein
MYPLPLQAPLCCCNCIYTIPPLGDLAPWVANNAADRMPDDGELRGSLDDFYTVQAGGEVLGLDTSLIDSLDNDPRSMRPVS